MIITSTSKTFTQGKVLPVGITQTRNAQKPMWPWPSTLIFNRVLEVVKVNAHAKFHQVKCSVSWVIMLTEKKTQLKTILPSTRWAVIIMLYKCAYDDKWGICCTVDVQPYKDVELVPLVHAAWPSSQQCHSECHSLHHSLLHNSLSIQCNKHAKNEHKNSSWWTLTAS